MSVILQDKPTAENTTKITAVRGADNYTKDYTDSNDIKVFVNALNNAKSVKASSRNLDDEKPISLTFYKGGEELKYELYLSAKDTDCLLKNADNELMLLNARDADALLNSPISDTVYDHSQIPQAIIPQGQDNKTIYPSSGDWYLKKPSGNFYPSTVGNMLVENAETNSVRVFQNKPLNLQFAVQPDNINVKVYSNKEVVFDDVYSNFDSNFYSDVNESLQMVVTAEWLQNDTNDYYGSAEYDIDVSYEVPAIFAVSETEANPGDIVIFTGANITDGSSYTVDVSSPDSTNNTDSAGNTDASIIYSTNFAAADGKEIALVPIGIDFAGKTINVSISGGDQPVNYQINVAALSGSTGAAGSAISARTDNGNVDNNLSDSAIKTKNDEYAKILAVADNFSSKYWDGSFIYPREGKEWLIYGQKVSINGNTYSYINSATNLDVNPKEPILASNAGKVIYAGTVPDDGNLIVIDHGMGVKSWYGHLADMSVKVGDDITKGQQIGTAGNTGLYTSIQYNLYFAVSVKDIFINPIWLIKNGIAGTDLPDSAAPTSNDINYGDIPSVAPEPESESQSASAAPVVSAPSDTSGSQTAQTSQTVPALSAP